MTTSSKLCTAAGLAIATGIAFTTVGSAFAEPPSATSDIAGRTVYLQPGSWLRYSDALVSRVYTTTKATLELKGRGRCTTRLCPVTHNNVELWALIGRLELAKPISATIVTERTLRRGDEGADVKLAQEALNKLGNKLTVDSKYGSGTVRAVEEFQRKSNVTVDGEIGAATRKLLKL